jgi:hypothetical protein
MMYLIVLDHQSKDNKVRSSVQAAIKTMGNWSNRLEDGWLLEAPNRSARHIRDHLKQFLQREDRLFVARISRNWAGSNMGAGFPDWIKRREFGKFPND